MNSMDSINEVRNIEESPPPAVGLSVKSRNYGIDLMRILMMYFVVVLHMINRGQLMQATLQNDNGKFIVFTKAAVFIAVDGFALISGYVGVKSSFKWSRIINLYLTVSFYNIMIPVYLHFLNGRIIEKQDILDCLFPVAYNTHWYFTAYFGAFFITSFMNKGIKELSKKSAIGVMIILFATFSAVPFWVKVDGPLSVRNGYSVMWITIVYTIGAILGSHEFFKKIKGFIFLFLYIGFTFLSWWIIWHKGKDRIDDEAWILSYISPIIILQAATLLLFFSNLNVPKFLCKIIKILAPLSFSVYIIHTNKHIWETLYGICTKYGEKNLAGCLGGLFGEAGQIFLICIVIDFFRHLIFKGFSAIPKKLKAKKLSE